MMTWETHDSGELIETQDTAEALVRLARNRLDDVAPNLRTPYLRRCYNALRRWYWLRKWQRGDVRFMLHNYLDSQR